MAQLPMKRLGVDAVLVGLLRLGGCWRLKLLLRRVNKSFWEPYHCRHCLSHAAQGRKKKHQLPFDNS
jgi:hypothetical protein